VHGDECRKTGKKGTVLTKVIEDQFGDEAVAAKGVVPGSRGGEAKSALEVRGKGGGAHEKKKKEKEDVARRVSP